MSTWTFKARLIAAVGVLTLAACDELPLPQATGGGGAKALTQTTLARGTVRLSAPEGYCIDPRSLRDRFALLGRCDTLGVDGFFRDKDLAIITTSVSPVSAGTANPDPSALTADTDAELEDTVQRDGIYLVRLLGKTSAIEGVSETFWRTAFVLNDQLINLVLYAPPGSPALGNEGARVLQRAVNATRQATEQSSG